MTINDILNEVNVEFGNGQSLAVADALKQRTTLDKTGAKDELYTKTADLSTCNADTDSSVKNVTNYLIKKGVWNKVATKQSFRTTDLVFKGDGSCQVNYDEGGGILIPKEVVNAKTPAAQKTFIQKFREKIQASTITEEILEEDVKEKIAKFVKNKLIPCAVVAGIMAGGVAAVSASTKSMVNSVKKTVKILAANKDKVQAVVGNDNISYDANKNILTVNGKSKKASDSVQDAWWDAFPDETDVEFTDEKVGSDTLQRLQPAQLNPTGRNLQENYFPY